MVSLHKCFLLRHIVFLRRFMWVLVFLAGLCFSGYFCLQMWRKWDESPVLTSLDSNYYPLKNIPFPAVTICNVNKVSKKKLLQFMDNPKYIAVYFNSKFFSYLFYIEYFTFNFRYAGVSFERMQETLRYMTKLDRAILAEQQLQQLSQFFRSENISPMDLFMLLREVNF